jgi:hypothetical protein
MGTFPMIVSRYMGAEDVNLAKTTVRELGRALGIKYGSLAVDSCIADFYEAFLSRVENTTTTLRMGASYSQWLHQWIGCLIVSREVSPYRCSISGGQTKRRKTHTNNLPLLFDRF